MDAREALGDDRLDAQIQRHQCGMFAGRTLAIVCAADHDALAVLPAASREFLIADAEAEIAEVRNVGAVGQDLCASRHDVVGGDVVAHLEQRFCRDGFRQRVRRGERL